MANMKTRAIKTPEGTDCPEGWDSLQQTREDYIAELLAQIGAFEEQLDTLEADMESSGWEDIGDYRGQIDGLRAKLKGLRSRSGELEVIADAGWPGVHAEMEESLAEAAGAVEELMAGLSLVLPE